MHAWNAMGVQGVSTQSTYTKEKEIYTIWAIYSKYCKTCFTGAGDSACSEGLLQFFLTTFFSMLKDVHSSTWCWKLDFQITCWASSEKVTTYLLPSQANTNDTANVRTSVFTCISHSAVYSQYMHNKKQHCSKTKAFTGHITQRNSSIIQARVGLPILGKLLRHKKSTFRLKEI